MKYLSGGPMHFPMGGTAFGEGWERTFGTRKPATCPTHPPEHAPAHAETCEACVLVLVDVGTPPCPFHATEGATTARENADGCAECAAAEATAT